MAMTEDFKTKKNYCFFCWTDLRRKNQQTKAKIIKLFLPKFLDRFLMSLSQNHIQYFDRSRYSETLVRLFVCYSWCKSHSPTNTNSPTIKTSHHNHNQSIYCIILLEYKIIIIWYLQMEFVEQLKVTTTTTKDAKQSFQTKKCLFYLLFFSSH